MTGQPKSRSSKIPMARELSPETARWLQPYAGCEISRIVMAPVSDEDMARELHGLAGICVWAMTADSDMQIPDDLFDECLEQGVWVCPDSGEITSTDDVSFFADLTMADIAEISCLIDDSRPIVGCSKDV